MRRGAVVFVMVTLLVSRAHWFGDAVQFSQLPPVQLSNQEESWTVRSSSSTGTPPCPSACSSSTGCGAASSTAPCVPATPCHRRGPSRPSSASPAARWSRRTSSSPARATSRCARARRPAWRRSSADTRVRPSPTGTGAGPVGRMPRSSANRRPGRPASPVRDPSRRPPARHHCGSGRGPADRPAAGPALDRAHRHARVALGVAARRITRHPVGVAAAVRRRGAPRAGRRPPPPGPRGRLRGRRRGRHGGHQRGARARGIRTGLARRRVSRDRRRAPRVPLGAAHPRAARCPHATGGRRWRRDRRRGTATDAARRPMPSWSRRATSTRSAGACRWPPGWNCSTGHATSAPS